MNILCINHEYPPIGGGAATATRELLTRLYKRGHQIVLLTEEIPKDASSLGNPEFPVFRVNAGRRSVSQGSYLEFLRFCVKSLLMLGKINRLFHPDITVAFFTIPGGLLAMIQKWWYGTPYIVSIRGGDVPGFIVDKKLAFFHFLSRPLIKLVCKKASLIHTNSERLGVLVRRLLPDIPIKIIPNGVVFDVNRAGGKTVNDFLMNTYRGKFFKILFAGRLSKQKNLDTFLLGMSGLSDQRKEKVKITIVGEGPEKQKLEKLVKEHGLSGMVQFQTWMDRKDLRKIYETHTLSVVPSLDEGMANSVLESIASGCPVLGSRKGSLPWKEKGLLDRWIVKNELDAAGWKDQIVFLMDNLEIISRDFNSMYSAVINHFNWENLLPHYETMVKSVVNKKHLHEGLVTI